MDFETSDVGSENPSESAFGFQLSLVLAGDPKDPARREKTQSQTFTALCFLGWVSTSLILTVIPSMGRTVYLDIFTYIEWLIFRVNDGKCKEIIPVPKFNMEPENGTLE